MTAAPETKSYASNLEAFLECNREQMISVFQYELAAAMKRSAAKYKVSRAIKSDQYRTPKWVIDLIAARVHVHQDEWYDLCEYDESWDEARCYNFATAGWPTNRLCFMNPPYSQTSAAIFKALLEFCRGGNVVLLVKYTSALEASEIKFECLFKLGSVEQPPYPVAFVGEKNANGNVLDQPLVLIYLLQPRVWQHIMNMDCKTGPHKAAALIGESRLQHRKLKGAEPAHIRNVRAHMQVHLDQGMSVRKLGKMTTLRRLAEK